MIYLDHNATTPVLPEVRVAMLPWLFSQDCSSSDPAAYSPSIPAWPSTGQPATRGGPALNRFKNVTYSGLSSKKTHEADRIHLENFIPLNVMMEHAGMSEMDIYNRTRDVFLYFKLPFDSPPPEE